MKKFILPIFGLALTLLLLSFSYAYAQDEVTINVTTTSGEKVSIVFNVNANGDVVNVRTLGGTHTVSISSEGAKQPPVANAGTSPKLNRNSNLRAGPGTDYAIVGKGETGQSVNVVGQFNDWYKLDNGQWIAAFLMDNAPINLPKVDAPAKPDNAPTGPDSAPEKVETQSASPAQRSGENVTLYVIRNRGKEEIMGIKNNGQSNLDIGGWVLDGSKGNDRCTIPSGTVLAPYETYAVATGDSTPRQPGFKCGDKPIWNNDGETIFLRPTSGGVIQISY